MSPPLVWTRGGATRWTVIREIARAGTTVLLTTQYLDEADQLADRIAVIDLGRLIAEGTAEHLKRQTGGEVLTVTVAENQLTDTVASVLGRHADERPQVDAEVGRVSISVTNGAGSLATIVRELDATGVSISGIELREPSLDEVFLALTGHAAQPTPAGDQPALGSAPTHARHARHVTSHGAPLGRVRRARHGETQPGYVRLPSCSSSRPSSR